MPKPDLKYQTKIQIERDGDEISIFIFPDKFFCVSRVEAKLLAYRLLDIANEDQTG